MVYYSALHYASKAEKSALSAATYAAQLKNATFGNIGDIKYSCRNVVPNGGAWCDGALYTKAQFPDVYKMLVEGKLQSTTISEFDSTVSAYGSCGFFGLDTANERFKVPMHTDVYLKAGQAPSMFGAESLPNITGSAYNNDGNAITSYYPNKTGSFYGIQNLGAIGWYSKPDSNNNDSYGFSLGFDASRSSSTYQDGAKVNPDHVVYRAYVVLYASAAEASVAQAAEFINGLSLKEDKSNKVQDLTSPSERTYPSTQAIANESNRIINLIESKKYDIFPRTATDISGSRANWTAPSNGWLRFTYTSGNMATGEIYINSVLMVRTDWQNNWNSGNAYLTWPMKKGDNLTSSLPGYYTFWTTA